TRVDRDGLVGAAGLRSVVVAVPLVGRARLADLVLFPLEGHLDAAGRDPERVAAEADPIAARDRRAELVPAVGDTGQVVAGGAGHGLLGPRLRVGERRAEPADVGLRRVEADDGIRHAVGRGVEDVPGELAGERALIAGGVPDGGRRRPL